MDCLGRVEFVNILIFKVLLNILWICLRWFIYLLIKYLKVYGDFRGFCYLFVKELECNWLMFFLIF